MARDERRRKRRCEALGGVEEDDRQPVPAAVGAPDVSRADVPAPDRADVDAFERPHHPVAEGQRARDVTSGDEERVGQARIWYFETQSFTVAQSTLWKKASMYEPRSVWKSMK